MTETEWRQCSDPRRMLRALVTAGLGELHSGSVGGPRYSFAVSDEKQREVAAAFEAGRPPNDPPEGRKHLLFVAACCRRIEHLLIPEAGRLLELHELDADGHLRPGQEAAARKKFDAAARRPDPGRGRARAAATEAASWLLRGVHDTNDEALLDAIDEVVRRDPAYTGGPGGEGPHQAALLRDILGTPYAPVRFDKPWRSDTARALASQVYESRDSSAMLILADALQDAGCENEEVLNHCRSGGVHFRGCWVVDLVLGKV